MVRLGGFREPGFREPCGWVPRTAVTVAARDAYVHDSWQGCDTLEQRFRFDSPGVDPAAVADVLLTTPLIGEDSAFWEPSWYRGRSHPTERATCTVPSPSPTPG